MNTQEFKEKLSYRQLDGVLLDLYEDESLLDYQYQRYESAIDKFESLYGEGDFEIYTAAGRSEVGGNHTDHQHGRVLAAAINLDAIGIVRKRDNIIKVLSDDYDIPEIDLNHLEKVDSEEGTSVALIKGVVAKLKDLGYKIGGFDAYITSDVLIGAGLSSSAAFEDIIGTIIDGLYNDMAIDMVTIAKVGQYAENVYFGKPCGLMDQCACAVGGLITIDFKDPENPDVKHVDVDFGEFGYSLCIVDAKGSHANLTDEYAAVPAEMKAVAQFFGKDVLREVNVQDFLDHMDEVREKCGDRAALRAYHFFKENDRVPQEVAALENKDFPAFLNLVKASGNSSYKVLQNVYASSDPQHQSVSLALTLSEDLLDDHGVCRVHGGGFAGTIQAFVANDYVDTYKKGIEKYFGEGSCHVLKVRKYGGKKVL